jgi:hypothetical protein
MRNLLGGLGEAPRDKRKKTGALAAEMSIGQRYGRMVVQRVSENQGAFKTTMVDCLCDCGKEFRIGISTVRAGKCISCGCYTATDLDSIVGTRKGLLLVTRHYVRHASTGRDYEMVDCKCDCGRTDILRTEWFNRPERDRCYHCMMGKMISAGLQKVSLEDWEGFKVSDTQRDRNAPEIREWRYRVLRRDNYACQCCGAKHSLEVHHIRNFSSSNELRSDIGNGITLCRDCHSITSPGSFHSTYGARKNNKKQLTTYIRERRANFG